MDIRDFRIPGRRLLDRVNARHPWDHNEHFHGWILRNLPARRRTAVDIGCGTGVLAGKLAAHFTHVTGIDRDDGMAAAASARLGQLPQVSIRRCSLAEFIPAAGHRGADPAADHRGADPAAGHRGADSSAEDGGADLITMVAVLHHLDLDETLARLPGMLAPGGRLLVVGMARPDSLTDLAFDVGSAAPNLVMGLIKHPRAARLPQRTRDARPVMPVKDPVTTLAEIATAARARLPGATIRRRMFFRYTLRWDKPQ